MAWTTVTALNITLGTAQVTALGLSTAAVLAQFESRARASIVARLMYAGYSDPGSTIDTSTTGGALLSRICEAVLIRDAYALRKGVAIPPQTAAVVAQALAEADAIYDKKLPIPGLTPSTAAGYGGIQTSSTYDGGLGTSADARPRRFGRNDTTGL